MDLPSGYRLNRRLLRVASIAAPAAGADFTFTVPGGKIWRPQALFVQFVASATVANRALTLTFSMDGVKVAQVPQNNPIGAGVTLNVSWAIGMSAFQASGAQNYATAGMPNVALMPGATITSGTDGIQAGDAYGAPQLLLWEDYVEFADAGPIGGPGVESVPRAYLYPLPAIPGQG